MSTLLTIFSHYEKFTGHGSNDDFCIACRISIDSLANIRTDRFLLITSVDACLRSSRPRGTPLGDVGLLLPTKLLILLSSSFSSASSSSPPCPPLLFLLQ